MILQNSTLEVSRFKENFSDNYFDLGLKRKLGDEAPVVDDVVAKLQTVNCDAVAFLKALPGWCADNDLQECCRAAAIAQMYDVCSTKRSSHSYVDFPAYAQNIVLIQDHKTKTTAILDGCGTILFQEGCYYTQRSLFSLGQFYVQERSTGKFGILTGVGKWILPCVFDGIDLHRDGIDELFLKVPVKLKSGATIMYPSAFRLDWRVKENLKTYPDKDWVGYLIKRNNNGNCIVGLSADGVIFMIKPTASEKGTRGRIEDLKPLLGAYCLTDVQLLQIYNAL